MATLVTKEDIEGVLLRPLSDTENKYFEQLLQQATETFGGAARCQNAGRGKYAASI